MFGHHNKINQLKRYTLIFLTFIIGFSSFVRSQEIKASKINIVNYYGFEDQSSVDFINQVLADSSNVVFMMDFNFFNFEMIKKSKDFSGLLYEDCDSIFSRLSKQKRLFGGGFSNKLPINYLKWKDPISYQELDGQIIKFDSLKLKMSVDEKKIIFNEIDSKFNLSKYEHFFFNSLIFDTVSIISELQIGSEGHSNNYLLFRTYDQMNGIQKFVDKFSATGYQKYLMIVENGSRKTGKISLLNFNNRINKKDNLKPYGIFDYQLISSMLPKSINFSRNCKISLENLKDFDFIYVPKLENCQW